MRRLSVALERSVHLHPYGTGTAFAEPQKLPLLVHRDAFVIVDSIQRPRMCDLDNRSFQS